MSLICIFELFALKKLRLFMRLILISALVLTGAQEIAQTWIWGERPPLFLLDRNEEIEFLHGLDRHGFIRLIYNRKSKLLRIDLVKRPPEYLFPASVRFCSTMLPTTISEFIERYDLHEIESMHVHIDAHPYSAACKCYLRI
jgi:hypothetical protein